MGLKNGTFAWYKLISCLQTSRKVIVLEKLEYDGLSKFYPAGIYFLEMDNRSTRVICEISSKLTIKTAERRHWRCSSVFIVTFERISHIGFIVVDFVQVNAGWVLTLQLFLRSILSVLLTLSIFQTLFSCFCFCLWTEKCWLVSEFKKISLIIFVSITLNMFLTDNLYTRKMESS